MMWQEERGEMDAPTKLKESVQSKARHMSYYNSPIYLFIIYLFTKNIFLIYLRVLDGYHQ